MLQVAMSKDHPLEIRTIAEAEGLSTAYVGKLLHILKKAGLVKSLRGPRGGYLLAQSPDQITMSRVTEALSRNPKDEEEVCRKFPGELSRCAHIKENCSLRSVWGNIYREIWRVLNNVTLEQILNHRIPALEPGTTLHVLNQPIAGKETDYGSA